VKIRAISLHQPYATGVALKLKRHETRHWPANYSGPVAIHAAQRDTARECAIWDQITTVRPRVARPCWRRAWRRITRFRGERSLRSVISTLGRARN